MTKKILLPIISFILLFGFAVNINAEESESLENYKLTGKLIRKPRSWSLDLLYNEKEIKGEFYNRAAINLPVNTYKIGITIDKKKYKGNILKKKPLFGKDFYEIDMSCNRVPLEGEINKSFRKV